MAIVSSDDMSAKSRRLSDADYRRLLEFRDGLRVFLHWSEERAHEAELTAAQHQLLLAVRGSPKAPSLSELAAHLLLRHHSVVELVDRAELARLVKRQADTADHRVVRVALTPLGSKRLEKLAAVHLEELSRLGPRLSALWAELPEPDIEQR